MTDKKLTEAEQKLFEGMKSGEIKPPVQYFFHIQHGDQLPATIARVVLFHGQEITSIHSDVEEEQARQIIADYKIAISALELALDTRKETAR